jgi:hypothetical protein
LHTEAMGGNGDQNRETEDRGKAEQPLRCFPCNSKTLERDIRHMASCLKYIHSFGSWNCSLVFLRGHWHFRFRTRKKCKTYVHIVQKNWMLFFGCTPVLVSNSHQVPSFVLHITSLRLPYGKIVQTKEFQAL